MEDYYLKNRRHFKWIFICLRSAPEHGQKSFLLHLILLTAQHKPPFVNICFSLSIVNTVNMSSEGQSIAPDSSSTNPLQNSLNKSSQTLSPSKKSIESKVVLLGDTGKSQRIFLRHLQNLIKLIFEFFNSQSFGLTNNILCNRCRKDLNSYALCRKSIQLTHQFVCRGVVYLSGLVSLFLQILVYLMNYFTHSRQVDDVSVKL